MFTIVMQKIELRFCDIFLPLLSKSQILRNTVQAAVTFYHNDKFVQHVAVITMIGCAGFASGILIFTLKNFLG